MFVSIKFHIKKTSNSVRLWFIFNIPLLFMFLKTLNSVLFSHEIPNLVQFCEIPFYHQTPKFHFPTKKLYIAVNAYA